MQDYRKYIFAEGTDVERQQLQFLGLKPTFTKALERVLEEYGLADRLEEKVRLSPGSQSKLDILEFGSGEGLYLHHLAATIEKWGAATGVELLKGANLFGVDSSASTIATADDYKLVATPPRPYLNFYLHDLNTPLEECVELKAQLKAKSANKAGNQFAPPTPTPTPTPAVVSKHSESLLGLGERNSESVAVVTTATATTTRDTQVQFDFIYSVTILLHLSDAHKRLEELYRALKPGGIIYLREIILTQGEQGWLSFHPFSGKLAKLLFGAIASRNNGLEIAKFLGSWLSELGAEAVQEQGVIIPTGGDTPEGRYMIRQSLLGFNNLKSMLIGSGIISTQEFEQGWQALYRDISNKTTGQLGYRDVFARKPA